MKRTLRITVVFFGLWLAAGVAARPGDGLKLLDNRGFNNASTDLTYSLTDAQEIDVRSSVSADNLGDTDSRWHGKTRGHYDFHYDNVDFGASKLRPFVGANADYVYGSSVNDSLMAGPEAGLKVDVQPKTLLVVKAGYQSLYQDGDQIDESLSDGSFKYSLGIDFRF